MYQDVSCQKYGMDRKSLRRKKCNFPTCEIEQKGKAIGSCSGHGAREGQHSNLHVTSSISTVTTVTTFSNKDKIMSNKKLFLGENFHNTCHYL